MHFSTPLSVNNLLVCAIPMILIFGIASNILEQNHYTAYAVLPHFRSVFILTCYSSDADSVVQRVGKGLKFLSMQLFHCAICIVQQQVFIHLHCFPCLLHFNANANYKVGCVLELKIKTNVWIQNEGNRHISHDFKDIIYILVVCNCTCFILSFFFKFLNNFLLNTFYLHHFIFLRNITNAKSSNLRLGANLVFVNWFYSLSFCVSKVYFLCF